MQFIIVSRLINNKITNQIMFCSNAILTILRAHRTYPHLVTFDCRFCSTLFSLFDPLHVPDKQGLGWMTIRIRLKVIVAVIAAVKRMEFLQFILVNFQSNLRAIIIVVIIGMRFILHDVVVNVLDVMLRESMRLKGL